MSDEKLTADGTTNKVVTDIDPKQTLGDLVQDVLDAVDDLDGIRVLEYQTDGVYLTVLPPKGTGKIITAEEIIAELQEHQIQSYFEDIILQAVTAMQGEPVKIAEASNIKPVAGMVMARISQDGMEAFLRISPPKHGGEPVSLEQAINALKAQGVVFGLDQERVQRAVDLGNTGEEVPVAFGVPVEMGKDAELHYHYETSGIKIQPKELSDGRVDFYNLNLIQNVVNGQVLITKTPLTTGIEGTTVTGKAIPTKPGKDASIKAGKNTELIDNNCTLISTDSGHIVNQGGKISILPVYEVPGDVDFSTGNVDFVGNVVIKGNITEGFLVKAQGDVEVRGSIAGGSVMASGHLQVKNGIQGVGKGIVQCGGNVFTKFIENAKVSADGDIIVGEAIMHSYLNAKGTVMVGGRKGVLVGGITRAGGEITAKIVGSNLSTNTELESGVNPELREKYITASASFEEAKQNLDKTQKAFVLLKTMESNLGELPTDKKAMLVKVSRAQFQMMALVQTLQEQVKELAEELEINNRGKINISGIVHPGVKIIIGPSVYNVGDSLQFASFVREQGEIKIVPLK